MSEEKKIIIIDKDSEADTCRKYVIPKLYASKWDDDQIMEQRPFTDGQIVVIGRIAKRKKPKKADYLLRYTKNNLVAVIESKRHYKKAGDGLQQAKDYAEILKLRFAFATNGIDIIEFDYLTGEEKFIDTFPTPDDLWSRLKEQDKLPSEAIVRYQGLPDELPQEVQLDLRWHTLITTKKLLPVQEDVYLAPFHSTPHKKPRYYQELAINRSLYAVLAGEKRILLTLATGTGKTTIAFHIIHKLWSNRWNRHNTQRRPKILFIADRDVLVSDPHSKDFSIFGDARFLFPNPNISKGREIYFSTYQAIAEDERREGVYKQFPKDFFDLIVIDECHRGSSSDESNWKTILNYFDAAVQLGLTATPLREDNKDTYAYFRNPIYTYSLKQGIKDGFLAPYIVHRVVPDVDATGWRPENGQLDKYGYAIPDGVYGTPEFERTLSYLPRTKAVAKHLTNYLKKTNRFSKTIIFCVNQDHADDMRRELNNLNKDITKEHSNYVVRIVSDEGNIGKGFLSNFMDVDGEFPVLVTTSKLLSTGVDVPTCENIVIFRMVNSMNEFKQIIGRGTRVREDKKKLFFTILDYTGSATRNFADPDFDGQPPLITNEEINEDGEAIDGAYVQEETIGETSEEYGEDTNNEDDFLDLDGEDTGEGGGPTSFRVETGEVGISVETIQYLDENGNLIQVELRKYVKDKIVETYPAFHHFKQAWDNIEQRKFLLEQLGNHNIPLNKLQEVTCLETSDIFDLICYVAYGLPPKTRKQRAELLKKNKPDFFQQYSDSAKQILEMILAKYIELGLLEISDTKVLKLSPISEQGNVIEIADRFGGLEQFKNALEELQYLLYAA